MVDHEEGTGEGCSDGLVGLHPCADARPNLLLRCVSEHEDEPGNVVSRHPLGVRSLSGGSGTARNKVRESLLQGNAAGRNASDCEDVLTVGSPPWQ